MLTYAPTARITLLIRKVYLAVNISSRCFKDCYTKQYDIVPWYSYNFGNSLFFYPWNEAGKKEERFLCRWKLCIHLFAEYFDLFYLSTRSSIYVIKVTNTCISTFILTISAFIEINMYKPMKKEIRIHSSDFTRTTYNSLPSGHVITMLYYDSIYYTTIRQL